MQRRGVGGAASRGNQGSWNGGGPNEQRHQQESPTLLHRARALIMLVPFVGPLINPMLLILELSSHLAVPWMICAMIMFCLAYFVSPVDVIPDYIPVLGYLDDYGVALMVTYYATAFSMFAVRLNEALDRYADRDDIPRGSEDDMDARQPIFQVEECVVCMEQASRVLFQPCRHLVTCQQCAPGLRTCPVCRCAIDQRDIVNS
jgi:uncharacterized membrane protein YkvA (DUF1232 family)